MPATYSFRIASSADVPVIKQLAEAIWEPTYRHILTKEQIDYMFDLIYTEEALLQQMQEGQTFILLHEGEQPVGFAALSEKDATRHIYKLNKIYLLPACQGNGLGKKLIRRAEEEAYSMGAAMLDLNVNRHNPAKLFYERCGYTILHEEDIPIGPYWMNDYVMRKALP